MRILVVEDDALVADYLRLSLREDGHAVDLATDGDEGRSLSAINQYDVIILDHMLPRQSGLDVLLGIRQRGDATPILMLTAKEREDDIVRALDAGADDYLTKPFQIRELRARIRALGRRRPTSQSSIVQVGNLVLDPARRRVSCGDRQLLLTPKEFTLLECLMFQPQQVVTRTMLLEKVWDMHFDPGSNVVDVHVARLRSKLEGVDTRVAIRTVRGSGFMLDPL